MLLSYDILFVFGPQKSQNSLGNILYTNTPLYTLYMYVYSVHVCMLLISLCYSTIGSCVNSPLHININKLAIAFSDLVSYEIGNTYYYAGTACI